MSEKRVWGQFAQCICIVRIDLKISRADGAFTCGEIVTRHNCDIVWSASNVRLIKASNFAPAQPLTRWLIIEHDAMMRRVWIIADPSPIVSDNFQTPYTLRQGQAIALQYSVQVLLRVYRYPELVQLLSLGKTSGGDDATSTTILGCGYGARILMPFVVEMALKAIITKHNRNEAPRTHDLTELFNQVHSELRDEIILVLFQPDIVMFSGPGSG